MLVDEHFLETAFESRVLFDVLTVLVERRRSDYVQFAARQSGLEHIACVHGAFSLARTHHCVQLVDEENDAAFGSCDFLQKLL